MKRLLCYAHFNEDNKLMGFVRHSIISMKNSCSDILFVSNSPLQASDKEFLETCCSKVFVNDNKGYDFYMWKTALDSVNYSDYDEIVLMNSSIFGPMIPLEPAFEEMALSTCDFWGITECFLIKPHLQSYFLVFKKRVIESEAFDLFWKSVLPMKNKNQIILNYEVGLTQWLVESGFIPESYCSFAKLSSYFNHIGKKLKVKDNSSVKHAAMLFHIGNPFLKVEPIKNNEIPLSAIKNYLVDKNYPSEYIEDMRKHHSAICPLCQSQSRRQYKNLKDRLNPFHDTRYDYYKCSNHNCGALWIQPRPNKDMIHLIYHNHHKDAGSSEPMPTLFSNVMNRHNSYTDTPSKRRMLFIGNPIEDNSALSTIHNLDIIEHHFFQTKNRHADALKEQLGSLGESELFDFIVIPYIIEHCYDAESFLKSCMQYLKPGGEIYLVTPNTCSFSHQLFRKYWYSLNTPRHITLFNQKTLKTLLLACGFENIETRTTSFNSKKHLMRSFDIMLDKSVTMDSEPRIARRLLISSLLIIGTMLNFVTKNHGEECLVTAVSPKR